MEINIGTILYDDKQLDSYEVVCIIEKQKGKYYDIQNLNQGNYPKRIRVVKQGEHYAPLSTNIKSIKFFTVKNKAQKSFNSKKLIALEKSESVLLADLENIRQKKKDLEGEVL